MSARSDPGPWIWAGALAGPLLWFFQQVAMGSLVEAQCQGRPWLVPVIWLACAAGVLAAMAVSWAGLRRLREADTLAYTQRRARFVGLLGVWMPPLFLLAMTWQGIAGLIYSGCER